MANQIIRWFYAEAKGNVAPCHLSFATEVPNETVDLPFDPKEYSAVLSLLQDPRSAFWDPATRTFSTNDAGDPIPAASPNVPNFRINWYLLFWRTNDHKGAIVLHGEGQTLVLDSLDPNPFNAYVQTLRTGQTAYWRNLTITTSRGAVP
ncbi:MAG TPA: hypothetical protein VN181_00670 [Thermoanaerobaculia bacterium]|nr:hypothetical protein [Thermoanaerobaculia bacterium]